MGNEPRVLTRPSTKGESVSVSTSQPWATVWIQEPHWERNWPDRKRRKFRWRSDENADRSTRENNPCSGGAAISWDSVLVGSERGGPGLLTSTQFVAPAPLAPTPAARVRENRGAVPRCCVPAAGARYGDEATAVRQRSPGVERGVSRECPGHELCACEEPGHPLRTPRVAHPNY